jgi:glycosyltransferase involved in cell wall biosynthesis
MTLLVRNEADIIRDVIEYHISRGVDHFIVTDNGSDDGTVEIIEEYKRAGLAELIHETEDNYAQAEWVTRMALAARERLGADWIINSDADEFWYHPSGSLKAVCAGHSETLLRLRRRNMLPPLAGEYSERASALSSMKLAVVTPQFESSRENLDHYMLMRLGPKVVCRAAGLLSVAQGNHDGHYSHDKIVSDADNARIYHYPIRSYSQFERKVIQGGEALARNSSLPIGSGYHWRSWYELYRRGELRPYYDHMVLSAVTRRTLLGKGVLQEDQTMAQAIFRRRGEAAY